MGTTWSFYRGRTAIIPSAPSPDDASIAVAMRRAALAVLSRSMVLLALIAAVTASSSNSSIPMGAPPRRPLALPGIHPLCGHLFGTESASDPPGCPDPPATKTPRQLTLSFATLALRSATTEEATAQPCPATTEAATRAVP